MARVCPFRAWRYNPQRTPIRQVVTQPYDKITPAMQESYYQASPYNLVRVILGKRFEADTASENVYTRAAAAFQNWRQTGVLQQDSLPSLYRYSQTFAVPGGQSSPGGPASSGLPSSAGGPFAERWGFIGLGRIEDYSAGVVFRHEQTLAKPKADRLDLLRSTRAHFGQIFMLYNGAGKVDEIFDAALSAGRPAGSAIAAPDIEVADEYGVIHRVWKVSEPSVIAHVQEQMREQRLIIADGHHRYETALTYRNERRQAVSAAAAHDCALGDSAPHDYVMMTFVDMDRPGLVILPTHRAVSGLPQSKIDSFSREARQFFNVEEVDPAIDAARATVILQQAGLSGTALLVAGRDRAFLLHTPKSVGKALFGAFSLWQQSLDVVQLHKCLLETCLVISEEAIRDKKNVSYFRETTEALAQVRDGRVQLAFMMNPVRMKQVRDIAFAGEVLPQKSTDFYPKLLSGLTIYALD